MQSPSISGIGVCLAVAGLALARSASQGDEAGKDPLHSPATRKVRFDRDVRPLLSDACFSCHGPDETKRRADVRLDSKDDLFDDLGGYSLVVPGDPASSVLLERITAEDPRKRMPPPKSGLKLTGDEIALLRRWVEEGASWEEPWSLRAPVDAPPPAVGRADWPRNPIDRFILARLEQEGLDPSPEADRTTLIRRVSQDLTGLPPTPVEVDAHLSDGSPDAYEKVVEGLLASPRYGERMALEWLDLARYADTHGFHIDSQRDMWRWRDVTISAFNRNLPYDQFTVEQLAGDLLPDPTLDQRISSGFNRNNMVNFEGGAIPEEYHAEYVADRVHTTSTVFLGATMACARCHDHKYDPISQRDFYRFFAFFNNVPENGLDGSRGNAVPFIEAPTSSQEEELRGLDALARELEARLLALEPEIEAAMGRWESDAVATLAPPPRQGLLAHYELDGHLADTSGGYRHGTISGGGAAFVEGVIASALRLDGSARVLVGPANDFEVSDAFSYAAWVRPSEPSGASGAGPANDHMAVLSKMDDAASFRGYDLYLADGKVFVHMIHQWDGSAIRVNTREALTPDGFHHIAATYDGSGKAAGIRIYVDGVPRALEVTHDRLSGSIRSSAPFTIGGRTPGAPFRGDIDDVRLYARVLAPDEVIALATEEPLRAILARPPGMRDESQRAAIRRRFLAAHAPAEYRELRAELDAVRERRQEAEAGIVTTMVMQEMETPRETFVLRRGVYSERGERVEPGVPACFPPLPEGAPPNRLGLARWIVDPANPRTARVTVNRFWQMLFGTGIVKTAEDFGSQGELPSHPELLDWLGLELVRSGWDVKAILRLIVTSATYRQSARVTPELLERDPENRLLARGPRFRLKAEMIRDGALFASGLLVERIGGPSVKPYEPGDLWKDVSYGAEFSAQSFVQDRGEALYRRSMYTFWKRSSPPATLYTFDAPDRETCAVRRARTNTPLQALALLNDVTYVEAARALAERMMREGGTDPAGRLELGFRLATARRPEKEETRICLGVLEAQLVVYRGDPEAASRLLGVGESPRDGTFDEAEHAAWTVVASLILNLDETITKG